MDKVEKLVYSLIKDAPIIKYDGGNWLPVRNLRCLMMFEQSQYVNN